MRRCAVCLGENPGMYEKHPEELEAVTSFLSTSICYYMIDFVYYRKRYRGTGKAGCAVYDAGDCKTGRGACRIAPAHRSIVMLF